MKRSPVAGPILALSIATLLLAGCGGGGTGEDDSANESASSSAGDSSATSGSAPASDSAGSPPPASSDEDDSSSDGLSVELQVAKGVLKEDDPNRRMGILDSLRRKGAEAAPLLPQIRDLATDDPDADVRTMVVHALVAIEGDESVETLAEMLADESEVVRVEVLNAFADLDTDKVAPHLLAAIDSDDAGVRAEAISIVGKKGIESDEAFEKLEAALEDMDGAVIRAAVQALGDLIAVDSAPAIAKAVMDRDAGVRQNACRVLGELGEPTQEVVYALFRGLDDESLGVREAAFDALVDLTNPDDTFGYNAGEVDEKTRTAAAAKWKSAWESKSGSGG